MSALANISTAVLPPVPYFGGKAKVAGLIADAFPAHEHYVEPFAGSLAVFLAKKPALISTLSDVDGLLMLFWKVLRDRTDELVRVCLATPHARAGHQEALAGLDGADGADELEMARRVWVCLTQGRGAKLKRTGWRYVANPVVGQGMPALLESYVDRMEAGAARLRSASLESRPALELVADYGRHPGVLVYADPPYLAGTRSTSTEYRHEMGGEDEHRELAAALRGCDAAVVLSGYQSPLYSELYDGWHRREIVTHTAQGAHGGGDPARVEVLWSNRPFAGDPDDLFGGEYP